MAKVGHFKVLVLAGFLALAVVLVAVSPAGALIGGEPDGDEHPYVGMVGFYDEAGTSTYGCSGTLLSPTVFLTAGHCTFGMARGSPAPVVLRGRRIPTQTSPVAATFSTRSRTPTTWGLWFSTSRSLSGATAGYRN